MSYNLILNNFCFYHFFVEALWKNIENDWNISKNISDLNKAFLDFFCHFLSFARRPLRKNGKNKSCRESNYKILSS